MQGKVKWFNPALGYGFITNEEGKDYFAYFSDVQVDGFKRLFDREAVNFEVGEGPDGREKAINIIPQDMERHMERSRRRARSEAASEGEPASAEEDGSAE